MLASLWGMIKFIIMLVILAVALYSVGYIFDWLPEKYAPHKLFPNTFKSLKLELQQDAYSTSSTAKVARWLFDYITAKEKYYDEQREEEQKKAEAAAANKDNNPGNPIEKTKELIQQIEQRNKALDEL